jgi:hypothetical protein
VAPHYLTRWATAPATATRVRVHNRKRLVTDGPFAESKEQLGGFYPIDVPISTRRSPSPQVIPRRAFSVEIRPALQIPALTAD